MAVTLVRSFFDYLAERGREEQDRREVRQQAGFLRHFADMAQRTGMRLGDLFPLGLDYERQRLEDIRQRPGRYAAQRREEGPLMAAQRMAFQGQVPPGYQRVTTLPPLGPAAYQRPLEEPSPEEEEAQRQETLEAVRASRPERAPTLTPEQQIQQQMAFLRGEVQQGRITREEAAQQLQEFAQEAQLGNVRPTGLLGAPLPGGALESLIPEPALQAVEENLGPFGRPVRREAEFLTSLPGLAFAARFPGLTGMSALGGVAAGAAAEPLPIPDWGKGLIQTAGNILAPGAGLLPLRRPGFLRGGGVTPGPLAEPEIVRPVSPEAARPAAEAGQAPDLDALAARMPQRRVGTADLAFRLEVLRKVRRRVDQGVPFRQAFDDLSNTEQLAFGMTPSVDDISDDSLSFLQRTLDEATASAGRAAAPVEGAVPPTGEMPVGRAAEAARPVARAAEHPLGPGAPGEPAWMRIAREQETRQRQAAPYERGMEADIAAGLQPEAAARRTRADLDEVGEALEHMSGQPDRPIPVVPKHRLSALDQYVSQQIAAKNARSQAKERLGFVRKAVRDQLQPSSRLREAELDLVRARAAVKRADKAIKEAEIRVGMDDIAQRARTAGARPEHVAALTAVYENSARMVPRTEELLSASSRRQLLARIVAAIEGTPPGTVGQIAEQRSIVETIMREQTAEELDVVAKALDFHLYREMDNLTYVGSKDVSLPRWWRKMAAEEQLAFLADNGITEKALVQHPDWWRGMSPDLKQALKMAQEFQSGKLAIAEAMGYPIQAIDGPYLEQMWEIESSVLAAAVPRMQGRVSIAKQRVFGDYIEGVHQGFKPKERTVGELLEHSSGLMDQAIADAFERRLVLERFGIRGKGIVKRGTQRFGHPLYQGWAAPTEIVRFVDQLHNPVLPAVRVAQAPAAAVKGTVFGPGDIAVFVTHMLDAMTMRGPLAVGAAINRGLRVSHLPNLHTNIADDLPRKLRYMADGLEYGMGPASVKLKGGTVIKYVPYVGKYVDRPISRAIDELAKLQYFTILRPFRELLHEGNLIALHLTGSDITDPMVRRASADFANAPTGASRGAMTRGRRAVEEVGLISAQFTRSEPARWMQLAKALTPAATKEERVLAAITLATFASTLYGIAQAYNMMFGGKEVDFNPANPGSYRITIAGQSIPIVARLALIRAFGKSFDVIQETVRGKEGAQPAELARIWTQYIGGKLNPATAPVQSALGFGYEPGIGRYEVGTLSTKGRLLNMVPLPPIAEMAITEPRSRTPAGYGFQATGFSAYAQPAFEILEQARQEGMRERGYAGDWDQFKTDYPGEAALIDKTPAVQEALQLVDREAWETEEGRAFDVVEELRAEVQTAQEADDARVDLPPPTGMNGEVWKDRFRSRQKTLYDQREAIFAFVGMEFEEKEPTKGTPGAALRAYFEVNIDDYTDLQTGEVDWDAFFAARDKALAPLSVAERRKLEREVIHKYDTPTVREFRRAQEIVDRFYEMPKYKGLTAEEGQELDDFLNKIVPQFQTDYQRRIGVELDRRTAIILAARAVNLPRSLLTLALTLGRRRMREIFLRPERDEVLLENQVILAKFYPDLLEREFSREEEAGLSEPAYQQLSVGAGF